MSALINTARIGVKNEFFIKIGIQNSIDCVVEKSVCHPRFVDTPWFWIVYLKGKIFSVPVSFVSQLLVKINKIIDQVEGKFKNIPALFLTL
ncbi:hypothetical protein A3F62_01095 [Candidatus Woesebacteria bacterium RIFCSPHIGHO2_12_FULL_44_11]|uniref:Uncharacterized protein n=1 Tax=Candidatus Woesebacteria bacterium RIFCSPLOWO2_01_FULL_44_14 TaxID=1802525 RepID=A0A1F8C3J1_9BACT|nr:MAG: hypothetical protein A3F62_01095 [Candidatus Woesebacteria bacterium RIFCSPHIGHO2_12_FULL_44_11]OGM70235.1 MAG: hypothetical protein A2975_04145 [Candidatus Woesebacteria bacterium RIFCSPLOWO2_01_FULL_44_14]